MRVPLNATTRDRQAQLLVLPLYSFVVFICTSTLWYASLLLPLRRRSSQGYAVP
jgi:hypothetical protein